MLDLYLEETHRRLTFLF